MAGRIPSARARKPDLPDGVIAILERALQRDPAKRFPSAGSMGEACEHVLYDKGYGPTNLTLKHHLAFLFPERETGPVADPEERFPIVEATLIPIGDGPTAPRLRPRDGATGVAGLERTYSRVVAERPAEGAPRTAGSTRPVAITRPPATRPPTTRPAATRPVTRSGATRPPTRKQAPRGRRTKARGRTRP